MSEQVIFKNQAFGGFNKEEVLKYIDGINAKNFEEQEQLNNEISNLTEELKVEKAKCSEKEASFAELMKAYEELREHYLMLKERSSNLESENTTLKIRCDKAEKELKIEKELNRQLEDKIETERQKSDEHAAEEEKIVAEVSRMSDSAKAMLDGARSDAQNIIADAQNSADGINAEIDSFCAEIEKTKAFMEDSLAVLVQRLDYIGHSASSAKISNVGNSEKSAAIQQNYEKIVSETEGRVEAFKKRFFH